MSTDFDHSKLNLAWVADDKTLFQVGQDSVLKIVEHPARGEGDRWFYDVHYERGKVIRVFDPRQACWTPDLVDDDIPF